jgi:hypothetical protein
VRFCNSYGVEGLRTSDPVAIGGVTLGRVQEIRTDIDKEDGQLYIVVISDIPSYIRHLFRCSRDGRGQTASAMAGDWWFCIPVSTEKSSAPTIASRVCRRADSVDLIVSSTRAIRRVWRMITYQLDARRRFTAGQAADEHGRSQCNLGEHPSRNDRR